MLQVAPGGPMLWYSILSCMVCVGEGMKWWHDCVTVCWWSRFAFLGRMGPALRRHSCRQQSRWGASLPSTFPPPHPPSRPARTLICSSHRLASSCLDSSIVALQPGGCCTGPALLRDAGHPVQRERKHCFGGARAARCSDSAGAIIASVRVQVLPSHVGGGESYRTPAAPKTTFVLAPLWREGVRTLSVHDHGRPRLGASTGNVGEGLRGPRERRGAVCSVHAEVARLGGQEERAPEQSPACIVSNRGALSCKDLMDMLAGYHRLSFDSMSSTLGSLATP